MGSDYFCDPFIGSGAVLLDTARRYPKLRLCANDADPGLVAFWKVVCGRTVEQFCDRVLQAVPTVGLFQEILESKPTGLEDLAFRFYFLNRTSFSGLWRGGPIGGYEQRTCWKIGTEWRAQKSVRDILEAHRLVGGRLAIACAPGTEYVARHLNQPMFVDPPYVAVGNSLLGIHYFVRASTKHFNLCI